MAAEWETDSLVTPCRLNGILTHESHCGGWIRYLLTALRIKMVHIQLILEYYTGINNCTVYSIWHIASKLTPAAWQLRVRKEVIFEWNHTAQSLSTKLLNQENYIRFCLPSCLMQQLINITCGTWRTMWMRQLQQVDTWSHDCFHSQACACNSNPQHQNRNYRPQQ